MCRYCRFLILKGDIYTQLLRGKLRDYHGRKAEGLYEPEDHEDSGETVTFRLLYLWTFNSVVSYTRLTVDHVSQYSWTDRGRTWKALPSLQELQEVGDCGGRKSQSQFSSGIRLLMSWPHSLCQSYTHAYVSNIAWTHTHIYRRWRRHESLIFMREHREN